MHAQRLDFYLAQINPLINKRVKKIKSLLLKKSPDHFIELELTMY